MAVFAQQLPLLTAGEHGGIMHKSKGDICSHGDTFVLCLLLSWHESCLSWWITRLYRLPHCARRMLSQSCRTTLRRESLMWISPSYWIKPSFLNLFMKKLTRDRVVPIISASISCDTLGSIFWGWSCAPKRASSS